MARAHSQGQLICWDEDDDHGIEDIGTEDIGDKGRAMTDSSDSFICINEEGIAKDDEDPVLGDTNGEQTTEVDPSSSDKKEANDDSDWEKWDDDD